MFPPPSNLPFPEEVISAVARWCDKDFACDVSFRDVEQYRRYVLWTTDYGRDGDPEEYGFYFPAD